MDSVFRFSFCGSDPGSLFRASRVPFFGASITVPKSGLMFWVLSAINRFALVNYRFSILGASNLITRTWFRFMVGYSRVRERESWYPAKRHNFRHVICHYTTDFRHKRYCKGRKADAKRLQGRGKQPERGLVRGAIRNLEGPTAETKT